MFFHISKTNQDNFPHNHITENFVISLDEGWQQTVDQHNNSIWFKGYLDNGLLKDYVLELVKEDIPTHSGLFCIIKIFDKGLIIRTDKLRSFPLRHDITLGLTNLHPIGDPVWTDSIVMLTNNLELLHTKYDVIGEINTELLSFDRVVDQVDALLDLKVKTFLALQTKPIKVFLSGGIDSTFVFSYIQKHTDNYELVLSSHIDYDYFYLKNHGYLKQFWGYSQIHHWKEDTILSSGAPGDEFSCRNPKTVDILLKYHGTSFNEVMNDIKFIDNSLNYKFFKKNYLEKIINTPPATNLSDAIRECCNYNLNDWQHWHLGRTLTYTPLRDIDMFKLYARLDVNALKEQLMNSAIQIKLIGKNNPKLLDILSPSKNELNYMENLVGLLHD